MELFKLNLRQFDDVINKTTSEGLSDEMKVFYEKTLLEAAKPNLVHQQFGKKVAIPKNSGSTIEFRKFNNLPEATTPLVEAVTPAGQALSETKVEAQCYEYGAYVMISDLLDLEAIDPILSVAIQKIGQNAGATLDKLTRNELVSGTNVLYAEYNGSTPTSRSQLTKNHILTPRTCARATSIMRRNNIPTYDGNYVAVIHPSVEFDMITSDGWVKLQEYTDNVRKVYEGEIGKIYDIRFVTTSNAKVYKSTGGSEDTDMDIATYATLVIGEDAYGVINVEGGGLETIIKQKGSAGTADPLNQRSTVGWKISAFTAKILQQERLLRIESGSSNSDIDDAN